MLGDVVLGSNFFMADATLSVGYVTSHIRRGWEIIHVTSQARNTSHTDTQLIDCLEYFFLLFFVCVYLNVDNTDYFSTQQWQTSQITVTQSGAKSMTCSHGRNILMIHSSKSQKCFSVIQVNKSHGWNQFRNIFIKLQWVKWRREKKRNIFKTKKISRRDISLVWNPQYTKK